MSRKIYEKNINFNATAEQAKFFDSHKVDIKQSDFMRAILDRAIKDYEKDPIGFMKRLNGND